MLIARGGRKPKSGTFRSPIGSGGGGSLALALLSVKSTKIETKLIIRKISQIDRTREIIRGIPPESEFGELLTFASSQRDTTIDFNVCMQRATYIAPDAY